MALGLKEEKNPEKENQSEQFIETTEHDDEKENNSPNDYRGNYDKLRDDYIEEEEIEETESRANPNEDDNKNSVNDRRLVPDKETEHIDKSNSSNTHHQQDHEGHTVIVFSEW